MTRTVRTLSLFAGAVATLAVAAIVVWFVARPPTAPQHVAASTEPVRTTFNFTPLAEPRSLPALHFTNAEGRALTMADFHGRVVLLNLWATWCVPCRKEMPALDRLEAKLGGPAFEVVPLSIDRQGLAAVQPFYRQLGLKTLRIYVDPSGDAAFAVGAPGVPTSLLVDRDGRELGRVVGAAEWDSPAAEALIRKYLRAQVDSAGRLSRAHP